MNIYILSNREVVKNEIAGNNGENNAEIINFHFPEQIVGIDMSKITKWIQFHNDSLDLLQMIENDKYSLTDLITQYESIEYQVLLKYNNLVLWKSNIDELDFGESLDIDVTITIDDLSVLNQLKLQIEELKKQYEETIKKGNDDIADLIKQVEDLETKINTAETLREITEQGRVTAESNRVNAETERNQKLNDLVKEVENTISKLAHSVEEYNQNAETQLNMLQSTADTGVSAVLGVKNTSIVEIQKEQENIIEAIGNEVNQSITEFDNHVTTKITEFDSNATSITTDFNNNATSKTNEFNTNSIEKLEEFNNNYEAKKEEINSEVNIQRITDLEEENEYQNKMIDILFSDKETEIAKGDNITLNDCIEAPIKNFKIRGKEIKQATETENLIDNEWEQGTIGGSGNLDVSNTIIRTKNYQKVYPNHLYKIARTITTNSSGYRFYDKDYNYIGTQGLAGMISSNVEANQMLTGVSSMEFTITNDNVAYMKIVDYSNDLSTIYTMTTEAINTDYPSPLEYVEGNQEIEQYTNLYNKENDIVGKIVNLTTLNLQDNEVWTISELIEVLPNIDVCFSYDVAKVGQLQISLYSESNTTTATTTKQADFRNKIGNKITVKLNKDTKYIRVGYRNDLYHNNLMLNYGTERIEYVTHKTSQKYQLSLPSMLSENDYIYYDEKKKKNFVHNSFKKEVFDGSEEWVLQSINDRGISNFKINLTFDYKYNSSDTIAFMTSFKKQTTIIANTYEEGFLVNNVKEIYIRINSSIADTDEKFKTWLSENPQEFIYLAETSIEAEITDTVLIEQLDRLRKIFTYSGTNHFVVTAKNGQACNLEIEYIKSSKSIILKLEDKITNLENLINSNTTIDNKEDEFIL